MGRVGAGPTLRRSVGAGRGPLRSTAAKRPRLRGPGRLRRH